MNTHKQGKIVEWTREQIQREAGEFSPSVLDVFLIVLSPIKFSILWLLNGMFPGSTNQDLKHAIKIPTCERCSAANTQVLDLDRERNTIRLVVHKRFAERFKAESAC